MPPFSATVPNPLRARQFLVSLENPRAPWGPGPQNSGASTHPKSVTVNPEDKPGIFFRGLNKIPFFHHICKILSISGLAWPTNHPRLLCAAGAGELHQILATRPVTCSCALRTYAERLANIHRFFRNPPKKMLKKPFKIMSQCPCKHGGFI